MTLDSLGWLATGISISSYFFRSPVALRRTQAVASLVWIGYGLLIHAVPLIAANVLVAGAAIYSSVQDARATRVRGGQTAQVTGS